MYVYHNMPMDSERRMKHMGRCPERHIILTGLTMRRKVNGTGRQIRFNWHARTEAYGSRSTLWKLGYNLRYPSGIIS